MQTSPAVEQDGKGKY